jgi:hypothetical protein
MTLSLETAHFNRQSIIPLKSGIYLYLSLCLVALTFIFIHMMSEVWERVQVRNLTLV